MACTVPGFSLEGNTGKTLLP
ncbi:MAG: hypothetical protein QG615_1102, partial [Nitrospirota bacterium]|nr:hypothetical protein [Nitrospirota bacterium]